MLTEMDAFASEVGQQIAGRAGELGLEIVSAGVRDVILPGDMKDLMNKVAEAKKVAEANLIARREEDGGDAQSGQHGQAAGEQPDADATLGTGSSGEGCYRWQAERRARREGPGRSGCEPVVTTTPLVRVIGPGAFLGASWGPTGDRALRGASTAKLSTGFCIL